MLGPLCIVLPIPPKLALQLVGFLKAKLIVILSETIEYEFIVTENFGAEDIT